MRDHGASALYGLLLGGIRRLRVAPDSISTMKKTKVAELRLMEKWKDVPIGTEVVITKDLGEKFHTKTRSAPWLLGGDSRDPSDPTHHPGHTAVMLFEGISGCYSLARVEKANQMGKC